MKSSIRALLLLCIAVSLPSVVHAQASLVDGFPMLASPTDAMLNAGDVVRITVWRKPELSGEFVVASDGSIAHPLYRVVSVAGVPFSVAQARLGEFLTQFDAEPQFVIEPLLRVAVGGQVMRPNLFTLRPETSVAQVIALAGGPTERGRMDRVRVVRHERDVVLDLTRSEAGVTEFRIRSGDQIIVDRRRSVFRDYIAPTVTLTGATAAILNVMLRRNR